MIRLERLLNVVDSHTAGEPTRIVTGGLPPLRATTVAGRRDELRDAHDWIRRTLVLEPRGHDAIVVAFVVPPDEPGADVGVVFANDVGYLGMCGHGAIGVATVLVATGVVPVSGPATPVVLDTPVGRVRTVVATPDGVPQSVTLTNVPAFAHELDVVLPVEGVGKLRVDIAFGGNWFAFVDEADAGVPVEAAHLDALMSRAIAIRAALAEHGHVGRDPVTGATAPIDHVKIVRRIGPREGKALTLCPGRAYDRSPCGTGTSAKLAVLHARGELGVGERFVQRSILDTAFVGTIDSVVGVGDVAAVVPVITGAAYVTAFAQFVVDPNDPLRHGFSVGAPAPESTPPSTPSSSFSPSS
jgi:proline racemase